MMIRKLSLLSVAVALVVIWSFSEVLAAEQELYWVNPSYSHLYSDPAQAFLKREKRSGETFECRSYTELQTTLKQQLEKRNTAFSIHAVYDFTWNEFGTILDQAFADATNGDDYLFFCITAWQAPYQGWDGDVTADYEVAYVASYDQEQQVARRVPEILADILEDGMNDEQQEKAIHDWVVANVEYDTTKVEHSAYAALFLGKTVCQGYSLLGYKMLENAGIEARIVNSKDMEHCWNMVNLCGHWYHLDATWDDPVPDVPGRILYTYYNKSDDEFESGSKPHYGWDKSAYPTAPDSYTEGVCDSETGPLEWQTSKTEAISLATGQEKKILLLAGRTTCGNCRYMHDDVCEMTSPPIRSLIRDNYIPWFCDVDSGAEWNTYAAGLGAFTLPLICCIDPADVSNYLDRTTGIQSPDDFYTRLQNFIETTGNINGTGGVDLADAILALQVCAGASAGSVQVKADVSGDSRIGLAEVIYILQKIANVRD